MLLMMMMMMMISVNSVRVDDYVSVLHVIRTLFGNRQKKKSDVKDAMRQLLNRYKKQIQENMHKVSRHILQLVTE